MASPALQPLQVIQVNLTGLFDGQRCICTFHYYVRAIGSPSTVLLQAVAPAWNDKYWKESAPGENDRLSYLFMPGVTDVVITSQIVFGPGSRSNLEAYNANPDVGTFPTGNPLTSGASLVVKRRGSLAGPKWRGRFYTFGLPQVLTLNSRINPAHADDVGQAISELAAPMTFGAGGNQLILDSCLFNGTSAPLTSQVGLAISYNEAVRYQRRREVGVGQ